MFTIFYKFVGYKTHSIKLLSPLVSSVRYDVKGPNEIIRYGY